MCLSGGLFYHQFYQVAMKLLQILCFLFCAYGLQAQDPVLVLPVGHNGDIHNIHFSHNGKKIVTASDDQTAKIWDAATGKLLHNLSGHTHDVIDAKFSPNDSKLITCSDDETAKIWDAVTGKLLLTIEGKQYHNFVVFNAEFSPDSSKILTTTNNDSKIWDARTGKLLFILNAHKELVTSGTFSPDGSKVITTAHDKTCKIWDTKSGRLLISFDHQGDVMGADVSKDGTRLLTTSELGDAHNRVHRVSLWDLTNNRQLLSNNGAGSASFCADGSRFLTVSGNDSLNIWDAKTAQNIILLRVQGIKNAKFYANSNDKVIASSDNIKTIVFRISDGSIVNQLKGINYSSVSEDFLKLAEIKGNYAKIWDLKSGKEMYSLNRHSSAIADARFSPNGTKIATALWNDKTAKIWDLKSGQLLHTLSGHTNFVRKVSFSTDSKKVLTIGWEGVVIVWDVFSGQMIHILSEKNNDIYAAGFSHDGKSVVTVSQSALEIWDIISGHITQKFSTLAINDAQFSSNDSKIVAATYDHKAIILDVKTGNRLVSLKGHIGEIKSVNFSPDDTKAVTTTGDNYTINTKDFTARIWDAGTGTLLSTLKHPESVFQAIFTADGSKLVTSCTDGIARIWDVKTGRLIKTMPKGSSAGAIDFTANQFITINNSEVTLSDLTSGKPKLSFSSIDSTDWAVIHPSGLFDASPGAMEKMYWVKGDEIIDLNQLKSRYWQPGLWAKIMDGKPLRSVEGMAVLKLQPEVSFRKINNDQIIITLKKREGGYGKVAVSLNNKEFIADARPADFDNTKQVQTITLNLKDYPELKGHISEGIQNQLSVKVQSADGFVSSRDIILTLNEDVKTNATKKPAFYAIICGTGEFSNPLMNLKYPVQDANAMAKAIALGAENLFGKDSTHLYVLSSPGNNATTKKNIQKAFAEVKAKAKPDDVVLVYLSGHGISYGGENGEFYYLTTDFSGSSSESFKDPAIRNNQSISTDEFTNWLNAIPALKQVMIIDACGSGKMVDNLIAGKGIEESQFKAIDRMKDRTGLFIISGCTADAVSYEASRYGQGLLTYSVLTAIKGAALRENRFVDIFTLLNFSRDEVPKMAKDIGGIQKPQLLVPKGGSFDIGIIRENDRSRIPVAAVKPVFIRSTLLEETKKKDVLKLSIAINDRLSELSGKPEGNPIVFIDTDDYPDACSISGTYKINGGLLSFSGLIACGINETPIQLNNISKDELIIQLLNKAGLGK